jgi:hypothetical protein
MSTFIGIAGMDQELRVPFGSGGRWYFCVTKEIYVAQSIEKAIGIQ